MTYALLQQAATALESLVEYQSSGESPTIHEYGQARRALGALRLAIGAQPVQPSQARELSDEEIDLIALDYALPHSTRSFARAITAATAPAPIPSIARRLITPWVSRVLSRLPNRP